MDFVIVGLSHKTAPIEVREKLAFSQVEIPAFLSELLSFEEVEEGLLVSTCNRVEACLASQVPGTAAEKAEQLILKMKALGPIKGVYRKNGTDAVRHFFKLTSGLDSMVLGEPQISGQVKEAYAQAIANRSTGPYLNKLVHRALNVSKRIRTDTEIGRHPVSISYAAVLLAEKIFGNFRGKKVMLLGAGEMGELAAQHLIEREARDIYIVNRTSEKAREVAQNLKADFEIHLSPWEKLPEKLVEMDIVIVSTGAKDFVISENMVREAMRQRKNEPMFFIDIAVPRNVEPSVNQIENIYLYDIDHLQNIVQNNIKEREREAKKAEIIIDEEAETFLNYVREMHLSPTIQKLSQKFDQIRRLELEKYWAKLSSLSEKDRDVVEACTKAIVNKIMHDPIILMKTEEVKEGGPRYSEILKKLFRLESESSED